MKRNFSKGFTLIELLVVVAIIALLAATILASLGGARTKARVSRAKSEMSSMRAQAELYYNNHSFTYGGDDANLEACGVSDMTNTVADDTVKRLLDSAIQVGPDMECQIGSSKWAIAATLDGTIFCVDSNGFSGNATATTANGAVNTGVCN